MSYLTVEVELDHGRVIAKEPDKLPLKGSALLTILEPTADSAAPRPVGLAKGKLAVPSNFNDPLPEEVLRDFEGK